MVQRIKFPDKYKNNLANGLNEIKNMYESQNEPEQTTIHA